MSASRDNPALPALRRRIAKAPTEPGVYRWLDSEGNVLYVGKAKNLKDRLKSYVTPAAKHTAWKEIMMRRVADVNLTVVNSELEAFVLETNLIKQFRPKFNIMMKDDKNYVYVRICMKDRFPRIDVVRKMEEDGAKYFGPKTSADLIRKNLSFLRSIFPFRTCKMEIEIQKAEGSSQKAENSDQLPLDVICTHRDRPTPCLDYHIKQCSAPCIGNCTPEQYYNDSIAGVIDFFEGKYRDIESRLKDQMAKAAHEKKFERAAQLRDHLLYIQELQEKQIVSDTSGENTDYIALALRMNRAFVVVLKEREGKIIDEEHRALSGDSEGVHDVLGQFLPQFYGESSDLPDAIMLSDVPDDLPAFEAWMSMMHGKKVRVHVPERGKKSSLLLLAEKNAQAKVDSMITKWEAQADSTKNALDQLAEVLQLEKTPDRIEGYDISHLGGSFTVGSMVVMQKGSPKRDHYRSFSVRGLDGEIDDYASLKEVLTRRLKYLGISLKEEEKQWKEKGITFGKTKKIDQSFIEKVLADSSLGLFDLRYQDFLVGRQEDGSIVTCARLYKYSGNILELKSIWVHDSWRGNKLGHFIARKILQSVKKGKVYVAIRNNLEAYYSQIGFRYVVKAPDILQQKVDEFHREHPEALPSIIMMWEAAKQKIDSSFSLRPDLLLIDGGKGQLGIAIDVLKNLNLNIPVASLAKREEEIFVPNAPASILLPKDSPAQFLLQRLRDEAHRFANSIREKQGKNAMLQSGLDAMNGIGPKTRTKLLKKFGSMERARQASDEELKGILNEGQLKAFWAEL